MSVLKLYNAEALTANTIKVHQKHSGCCNDSLTFCKYAATGIDITDGVTAITLTIDGSPEVVSFPEETTAKGIRVAIATALKSKGYDPYYNDSWKGISVDATSISIIGEAVVAKITINSIDVVISPLCTIGRVCSFVGTVDYDTDMGDLVIDGSAGTAVGTGAGFAAGDTAGIKAALIAALGTEGQAYQTVVIAEDTVLGAFTYTLALNGSPSVAVDGTVLTHAGCVPDLISA